MKVQVNGALKDILFYHQKINKKKLWCSDQWKIHLRIGKLNLDIFTHHPPGRGESLWMKDYDIWYLLVSNSHTFSLQVCAAPF